MKNCSVKTSLGRNIQKSLSATLVALLLLGMMGASAFAAPGPAPQEAGDAAFSDATEEPESEDGGDFSLLEEEDATEPLASGTTAALPAGSGSGEPISTLAAVTTPEGAFATTPIGTGTRITGFDSAWLTGEIPHLDSDGLLRINLVIPAQIGGRDVVEVSGGAFDQNNLWDATANPKLRITCIDFTQATSLTTIGDSAFRSFSTRATGSFPKESEAELYTELSVDNFSLPINLKTIGAEAFAGQVGLRGDLAIPGGVKALSNLVFYKCTGLTSVSLNKVETFSGNLGGTFLSCSGLRSIDLGVLKSFGSGSQNFAGCTALEGDLTIPDTLTSLGGVLSKQFIDGGINASGIRLVFPDNPLFASIPSETFLRAKVIGDLVIPEGITTIVGSAFRSTQISSVSFPRTLTSIMGSAFADISTLTSIEFSKTGTSLTLASYAFRNNQVEVLVVPEYLTSVGQYAFGAYQSTVPSALKTVYLNAPAATTTISTQNFTADAVVIAPSESAYHAWRAKPSSNVSTQITYELAVQFCDSDSDLPLAGLSSMKKLSNKSLWYVKGEGSEAAWTKASSEILPAVPLAEYPDATGWAFAVGGWPIPDVASQIVTGNTLYPSAEIAHEYFWYGAYPQRPLTADEIANLSASGWIEGKDYSLFDQAGSDEYYKFEPIRWRILEDDRNGSYRLMSETILDGITWGPQGTLWADSTVRSFLNDGSANGFIGSAFNEGEQARIALNGASDKVSILSVEEADTTMPGAVFVDKNDIMPHPAPNIYYGPRKTITIFGPEAFNWWVQYDPYFSRGYGVYLRESDGVVAASGGITPYPLGVRPVMTITLSSEDLLAHAGTYGDPYSIVAAGEASLSVDPTPSEPVTPVTPASSQEVTVGGTDILVDAPPDTATVPAPTSSAPTLESRASEPAGSEPEAIQEFSEEGNTVPLGDATHQNAWSILSLIVSLITFLSSAVLAMRLFVKIKSRQEYDAEAEQSTGGAKAVPRRALLLHSIALVAGLLPGILFLMMDDFSLTAVWIDHYTPFVLAAFAVAIALLIANILADRRSKTEGTGL